MTDDKPMDDENQTDDEKPNVTLATNMCAIAGLAGTVAAELDPEKCPEPSTLLMTLVLTTAMLDHLTANNPDRELFLKDLRTTGEAVWDELSAKFATSEDMLEHMSSHFFEQYADRSNEILMRRALAALMTEQQELEPEPDAKDVN